MADCSMPWARSVALAGALGVAIVAAHQLPLGMDRSQQVAASILLIAATLWVTEAVPLFVTSLLVLLLSLVWLQPVLESEGTPAAAVEFLSPFFSDVILLFLGGLVLSAALQRYGLDVLLGRGVIAVVGSSPRRLLLGIMAASAVLSMFLSNTATAATMLAVCLPIVRDLPEGDPFRKALVLGIAFAANAGGLGTPIGSPPNAIAMQYLAPGDGPSFGMWMLIGVPGVLGTVVMAWCVLCARFPSRSGRIVPSDRSDSPQASLHTYSVALLIVTAVLTVLGWTTTGLHGLSSGTVGLLPPVLLFGARALSVDDLKSLSWDVLLLMGGGLCLGVVIMRSGLDGWILDQVPVPSDSLYLAVIVFGALAVMMSSLMSNTATANLLMPVALGVGTASQTPILVAIAFACTLAMPLPVSTPPNALVFASGELSTPDMLLPGTVITVLAMLLAFTLGYAWWQAVGLS